MYPPIVCKTCGRSLGDIYHYVNDDKIERLKKEGINPDQFVILDQEKQKDIMKTILDSYHITNPCCKMHMVCCIEFKDHY
jgi:DNA-directed RNA polymerase subunit N (RpoN/RPB10)